MKNQKNLAALSLAALLSLSLLTACGGGTTPAPSAAPSQAAQPAVELKTVEKGKLHMATNAAFPPYEMVADGAGVAGTGFEGIDVEVANAIAGKLGLELVVDDQDFSAALLAAQNGQSDIVMAGVTVTDERKEVMNFTDSYAKGIQVIIVPEGSSIASVDDLASADKIGTQAGTTGYIYCSGDYGEDHVMSYDNGATAIQALLGGQLDAVVIDNEPAKALVAANEGLKILDTSYADEDYAIGISLDNVPLLDAINGALKELTADGTLASIVEKYIPSSASADFETVEKGKLHMATNAAFPPYEMVADGAGVAGTGFEGIDVEVANAIAGKLGLELVVDDQDFSAALLAAQNGQSDIVMAGVTVTDERKEVMNFTDSYAKGVQVIIVPEGSSIASVDDLASADKIGTQAGTTGYIYCSGDYGEDHVMSYDNGATAIQALLGGQLDAVVIDNEPAKALVEANEGLKILDTSYADEDYAIGISLDNEPLLAAINGALKELTADGTLASIVEKYIPAK